MLRALHTAARALRGTARALRGKRKGVRAHRRVRVSSPLLLGEPKGLGWEEEEKEEEGESVCGARRAPSTKAQGKKLLESSEQTPGQAGAGRTVRALRGCSSPLDTFCNCEGIKSDLIFFFSGFFSSFFLFKRER